jgi:hypothetical protein
MTGFPPILQAAVGAVLVAAGLSLMLGAARRVSEEPCIDCGEATPEEEAEIIARESARLTDDD